MNIPLELIDGFASGKAIIFLGPDLQKMAGLPCWAELKDQLGSTLGIPDEKRPQMIAQFYEYEYGKNALRTRVRDFFDASGKYPSDLHNVLVNLPASMIIAASIHDSLLEEALRNVNRKYYTIITDTDIHFWEEDRLQLVYLHGRLDRPESLVITRDEYHQYFNNHEKLANLLIDTLTKKTALFIGFEPNDERLLGILDYIRPHEDPLRRNHYIIIFDAKKLEVKDLRQKGLMAIELTADNNKNQTILNWLQAFSIKLPRLNKDRIISPPVNENIYREWLRDFTGYIDIRGLAARGAVQAQRFPLLELYMQLHAHEVISLEGAETELQGGTRRIPLTDVVKKNRLTLLLGDPGAGKTTFLSYLARIMVDNTSFPLPLLTRAADIYDFHLTRSRDIGPSWHVLISFWIGQSTTHGWGFTDAWLQGKLKSGQVLFLVDGLDELPSEEARIQIVEIIDSSVKEWSKCSWVVTSRPGVLQNISIPMDFRVSVIDTLSDKEIHTFISAWVNLLFYSNPNYGRTNSLQADQYERELLNTIRLRRDVNLLARNPVMLTSIILVHWNQPKLPEGKADLYEAVIDWLIRARYSMHSHKNKEFRENCYKTLALSMFLHQKGRLTRVGLRWAAEQIALNFDGSDKEDKIQQAQEFLEQDEIATGIIIRRGIGNISFWHTSFQEYLAACKIASMTDSGRKSWWSIIKKHLFSADWREVLRFFPAILHRLGDDRIDLLVNLVLNSRKDKSLAETAKVVGFLGFVLQDIFIYNYSVYRVSKYLEARDQVMQIFTPAEITLDLQTRYDAAVALGRGGDPRLFNQEKNWVRIPGGVACLGSQNKDILHSNYDEFSEQNEQPVHQVFSASFEIGKYPLTVQEFALFVEDGGYQDQFLWDPDGWEWRQQRQILSPNRWDEQLSYPNCPVVYVSLYEAQAYCNWLSRRDDEMIYRLPTEAEWEYVIRRGQSHYMRYIFGNMPPQDLGDKIHNDYSGLRHLAPIGLFPLDITHDGVIDMNGNIWEWVQNYGVDKYTSDLKQANHIEALDSKYRYRRGGGWHDQARAHRSAYRDCVLSVNRYDDTGFRVLRIHRPILIKGTLPIKTYPATLADIYAKYTDRVCSQAEADQELKSYASIFSSDINTRMIEKLFPKKMSERNAPIDRSLPIMDKVPQSKFEYNLLYQDTRIKLAVEEKLSAGSTANQYYQNAQNLMEVVAVLLSTEVNQSRQLWRDLADNDLDALIYMVLDCYDLARVDRLLITGYEANDRAMKGFQSSKSLDLNRLIEYEVFSGTVWWHSQGDSLEEQFTPMGKLEFDDRNQFLKETLSKECHMVFMFGDNGELVWDLALIQRLISQNPKLKVTGVVSSRVVANNANESTLKKCLEYPIFHDLSHSTRFSLFLEESSRSAIEPLFCSNKLQEVLRSADIAFIKGIAQFETMQKLPLTSYYAFVVHSADSQICTGLKKGSGVFVRLPKGKEAFHYLQETLRDIYPRLSRHAWD
ncbi:MAG: NACHT domain-containing protein [Chloroflexi bacterium]|nr:NACHT domain-containing protein [Chloroflexota bacterium]